LPFGLRGYQMRALFAGALEISINANKVATDKDIKMTLDHMREMIKHAEHEIHAILLACGDA
jgi:hypothetical protein